ncbi:MAG: apolipoprotein N-acyltransferase [Nibricoccus sp.]
MSPAADALCDPYDQPPTFFDKHRDWVWAVSIFVATVVLTVLSYPPYFPEFAYAFAAPAIFWAYLRPDFKLYAGTIAAAQMVAWTIMLGWLHHVTWLGLLLLGPFIGLWVGVWYLAAWWLMPRMIGRPTLNRLVMMLGLAAVWVIIEWTRNWLLSGFPWMPLAATQWTMVSMLQVAAYTGAVGVSFMVISVNIAFAAYAHRLFREGAKGLNRRSQEFFLVLFLVLACFCLFLVETMNRRGFTKPLARVAFVQPYIPQSVKWDESKADSIRQTLEELTLRAGESHPDLILMPEAVTPYAVKGEPWMQKWTEQLVARAGAQLLLGSVEIENPNSPNPIWRNSAFLIDPVSGLTPYGYSKRHLVPFGEYVPFRGALGWLKKFTDVGDGDFQAGKDASPMLVNSASGPFMIGPLICYEDIFPNLARESVLQGADAIAVVTNNAWYGEGGAAYQHAAHSVLRAVEMRRPVLRSGNGGWSGWIDEYGFIQAELKRLPGGGVTTKPRRDPTADEQLKGGSVYFRGTATVNVSYDTRWRGKLSFYAEHGDWFVSLCAGLATFAYYIARISKVPQKPAGEDAA